MAPANEARTISKRPALRATSAIINSGALPKVALSNPPMASPVRVESCSVEATIKAAIGTIATAAEKNKTGAGMLCTCSSTTVNGMNSRNQLIGFRRKITIALLEGGITAAACVVDMTRRLSHLWRLAHRFLKIDHRLLIHFQKPSARPIEICNQS